jgi:hypothetical protein
MKRAELNRMRKDELLKLARSKKLKVSGQMRKAEIVDLIAESRAGKGRKRPAASVKTRSKTAVKRSPAAGRRAPKQAAAKAGGTKRAKAKAKGRRAATAASKRAVKKAKSTKGKRPAPGAPEKAEPARAKGRKTKEPARARAARKLDGATIRQKAVASKYYLGAEEAVMPPVESMEIPGGYGIDRIVAMVRDPHWIFSYWEVTTDRYRELERRFGSKWPRCSMILRVAEVESDPPHRFDIELTADSRNWYINVQQDRSYQIAIGALSPDGTFVEVAVSNVVKTPRMGVSDVIDDRWMIPDEIFEKIFAASGGHDMQASSEELRALLEKRLLEEIASGAVSSFGSGAIREEERKRGFRLRVATELILYGATEPDAHVTIQGKEVKLRGDGTFSLRFALPDGQIDIPVTAVSADEIEERTIDTTVRKKSEEKEPVLR